MARRVLVTGGLGYIGSHTCVLLAQAGYQVGIVDNLCNAKASVFDRMRELAPGAPIDLQRVDIRDEPALEAYIARHRFDCVVHFAGLKAVNESIEKPLLYYENNVGGSISLLKAMQTCAVKRMVFSSSATVYGEPKRLPCTEEHPLNPINPYGRNKVMVEQLLSDYTAADASFQYAALRYFNPAGAHPSGRIGEDPRGVPNNLFPYISQVATGTRRALRVWGNDYPTRDGSGVRDYIHVMDLARAHLAALDFLQEGRGSIVANVGTGRGYSVLQAAKAYEKACGRPIPLEFQPRRPGDLAECYADPALARRELRWEAKLGLDEMCADSWRWQSSNPAGYP